MKAPNDTRRRVDDYAALEREAYETTTLLQMSAAINRIMGDSGGNINVSEDQHEVIEAGLVHVLELCAAKVNRIEALAKSLYSGEKGA